MENQNWNQNWELDESRKAFIELRKNNAELSEKITTVRADMTKNNAELLEKITTVRVLATLIASGLVAFAVKEFAWVYSIAHTNSLKA